MSMTDPVADLLTRVRNASKARKPVVDVPASNLKREIVRILKDNMYVRDFIELPDNKQGILRVYLRYSRGDVPVIKGLRRVSSPGLRRYFDAEKVRSSTRYTQGIAIVSTSSGIMTNFQAAEKGIGGEIMLRCW
ncbi:30S ribosomal protein S8 [candidate division GN15 bacterium]|uniref:Small ribosomal subunit protein uS8 n=1 Tax=candidate division GN15 bacterium TaxID=2072418 RepID=A0A855X110_9BACT|nr:MAG: 30S ribosomal protein S8 [candidate division GN15 bacterium]